MSNSDVASAESQSAIALQNATLPAAAASDAEPAPLLPPRRRPVKVRSLALAIVATLASIAALRLGSALFVPVMMGLVASYALTPLVDWLEKVHVPRALGAALILGGVVGSLSWVAYDHADDASSLIDSLPVAAEKLRQTMGVKSSQSPSTLEKVERAAEELQRTAAEPAADAKTKKSAAAKDVVRVQVERPKFSLRDYLWTGTMGLISLLSQIVVVLVLTFFLLAAGDSFRRKMVKLAGPTLSQKKLTLEALNEISGQIQRYLLVMVLLSVLTGLVTWGAFALLGMKNSAAWGALAGVLNLIPYLGSVAFAAAAILMAFVQFGSIELVLAIAAVCLLTHTVIGQFLTPWLTGRASSMNAVTMFVGVLVWGWIWGLWGLFLAVPILVIVKVVSDRVEDLKPIGEFLGE